MADETEVIETRAVDDAKPQAGAGEQKNGSQEESEKGKDEFVPKSELSKKNSENQSLRTRLRDAEDEIKKRDNATLSETQKMQKELEDAKGQISKYETGLKDTLLRNKVAELKDHFGIRSTKAIAKLVDTEALEYNLDNFDINGVEDELKRLKKDDPDLFITGGADGGKGSGERLGSTVTMNDIMRRSMGRR